MITDVATEPAIDVASRPAQSSSPRTAPRLYLVTPVVETAQALAGPLGEALAAADIAAVLLRLAEQGERSLINQVKALAPLVQAKDVALLLDGHADLVARSGADGAHLRGIEAFRAAVATLKPDRIAGCGGLVTRHDAMLAAEAGADYVLFGEPDDAGHRPNIESIRERVAWWAEVFETPCVGFAGAPDEVAPLAAAGADFVALGDFVFRDPRGVSAILAAAAAALAGTGAVA
jgi:thiamine-phosphate pyrophosphorylase